MGREKAKGKEEGRGVGGGGRSEGEKGERKEVRRGGGEEGIGGGEEGIGGEEEGREVKR